MKKLYKIVILLLIIFSSTPSFIPSVVMADTTTTVSAKAAIAVDAASGKILFNQNADQAGQGIASITKLLTVYMTYKEIQAGKLKWADKVSISDYAYSLTQGSVASNVAMAKGESFTVQDLVNACLIPSANSAAIALAEKIAGTEPKFVDTMTAQLKSWGVTDAKLINSSGLNNTDLPQANWYPGTDGTAENTMSAKDVAIIAVHLLKDFPQVLQITKQQTLVFDKGGASQTDMVNTDLMLPNSTYAYSGLDGLKTGTTVLAGSCFVGTAQQNGLRIITVVLNADDGSGSEDSRFAVTKSLMANIFETWEAYQISPARISLKEFKTVKVVNGKQSQVAVIPKDDVNVLAKSANVTYSLKFSNSKISVEAPLKKGQVVASVTASTTDKLGYLTGFTGHSISLITSSPVAKANPFVIAWNSFVNFVNKNL
ncbi:MAG: D-alanyl-D-alanine carboxypeptidase [Streptococcaceae bacterium]|jgi:D-alanyl-D-alanine carboxypeptidase (penicillin-binding protein 5/6)|nr:D-alanyl-D-alanine carboxypeptidase [Streptococcaceae bacterium]